VVVSEQQGPENSLSQQPSADEASADMRRALLDAGKTEFANYGYDGARLERIAAKAGCAKRMLYYYFGNKKDVYLAVIEQSYSDIRESEEQLNLDALEPLQALHALAQRSFEYHEQNQEFTRLVLQENFQGGEMLGQISADRAVARGCSSSWMRAGARGIWQPLLDQLRRICSARSSAAKALAHSHSRSFPGNRCLRDAFAIGADAAQLAQTLPVNGAGAGAAVQFLVVHQGVNLETARRCLHAPGHRVAALLCGLLQWRSGLNRT
jgi:AcrR family transcriptional regulator